MAKLWAVVTVCLLLALCPAVPGALEEPQVGEIGDDVGIFVDDRYAWMIDSATTTIRDTRTGSEATQATGCQPIDLHARRMLLLCDAAGSRTWKIQNVVRGTVAVAKGAEPRDAFSMVGRYWLRTSRCDPPQSCLTIYLQWHTGERKARNGPDFAQPPRDLDSPDLRVTGPKPKSGTQPVRIRNGPYLVTSHDFVGRNLRLRRRGRPSVLLSRCAHGCHDVSFAGRRVIAWSEPSRFRAFDVVTGSRFSWRFVPPDGASDLESFANVFQTRYETYFSIFTDLGIPDRPIHTRLYRLRWPR
jgi:hypothetical protein